uniref:Uncharacterized protein n=1 Tax=Oryza brachyantha TaxID=4533 RepID=J3LFX4_ORYBR
MDAYMWCRRGGGAAPACEEQEEDIGSPSTSASSARSSGSSSELADDASSSSSGSADRHFEMSDLMTQLPFKRGLSRFFDGKSQSFASLAAVASLENLKAQAASSVSGHYIFWFPPPMIKYRLQLQPEKVSTSIIQVHCMNFCPTVVISQWRNVRSLENILHKYNPSPFLTS